MQFFVVRQLPNPALPFAFFLALTRNYEMKGFQNRHLYAMKNTIGCCALIVIIIFTTIVMLLFTLAVFSTAATLETGITYLTSYLPNTDNNYHRQQSVL